MKTAVMIVWIQSLKQRLEKAGKGAVYALRAGAAVCLGGALARVGGAYVLPLSAVLLALALAVVALCGFKVNAFGILFAGALEYYAFAGSFQTGLVSAGLGLFAVFLFFASITPAKAGDFGARS